MSRVQWDFGRPNAKQDAVMKLRNRFIAYGGARGGGKSWMVRKWAVLNCLRYRGLKVLIIRATYPELEQNHIRPIREETRKFTQYNEQKKIIEDNKKALENKTLNNGDPTVKPKVLS